MPYTELGAVPFEESQEQVGGNYDVLAARKQTSQFVQMLRLRFPNPPEGCGFNLRSENAGGYTVHEACVYFPETEQGYLFAGFVDDHLPASWTDNARLDWKTGAQVLPPAEQSDASE